MIVPRLEQFRGCLIGQCLGDAVGCRVEGYPPEVCQNFVSYEVRLKKIKDRDRFGFPFGQYTDDSQLARELLQSYVACGEFDPSDYANRIADIFGQERIVGRGRSTEEAANRLIRGVAWQEAGTPAPSAGNGSAMRAAPIGLMFYDDPSQLVQAACDQGRITHQDSRCSAGAVAIASSVAIALQSEIIEAEPFLSQLSDWVAEVDSSFAVLLKDLIEWVKLPPESAVELISRAGLPLNYDRSWQGISPFVVGSVLWSLYAFLRTPQDYWETLCTSIAVGGDVDTTAAMACAISGAFLGQEAIPNQLAEFLNDRGTWGLGELIKLADNCYQLKMKL